MLLSLSRGRQPTIPATGSSSICIRGNRRCLKIPSVASEQQAEVEAKAEENATHAD